MLAKSMSQTASLALITLNQSKKRTQKCSKFHREDKIQQLTLLLIKAKSMTGY